MGLILKRYKLPNGGVNFPAIFSTVPSEERLPALYKKDFLQATALVVGALTLAFEKLSIKKMTGVFINNLAEEILDTVDEDNLSLEDLILFLQGLVRGKYGNVDELTIPRFMNLFDKFRDERHLAMVELRENEHLQHKGLGDSNRTAKEDPISEHLSNMSGRLIEMKDSLREKTKEVQKLKDIDNFGK